ncbi:MAG: M23 family metallopeptidase [Roseburia sp.]|nr:M23 family metallopeptidase [Roseburia sp.]
MKTYQSSTKDKKKNFFKRHWHVFVVAASVLVIAAVITLSVVLSMPDSKPVDETIVDPPAIDVNNDPAVMMPVKGATVGMEYAVDKLVEWETLKVWKVHPGTDFVGEGDVLAIMDGTVTDVERTTLDGNVVTISHDDGYVSVYKSLGNDIAVNVGDKVKAGDRLGVTSTSMMSELDTGAHLHLELKKNGKYVDPFTVLPTEDK